MMTDVKTICFHANVDDDDEGIVVVEFSIKKFTIKRIKLILFYLTIRSFLSVII